MSGPARYIIVTPVTFDTTAPPRRINSNDAGTYITLNPAPNISYLTTEAGDRITTEGT